VEKARPKSKQVSWRIPEPLRHGLTSHAAHLSRGAEKEITTEAMVAEWLAERLQTEERKRALNTLGITEDDLPKKAQKSSDEGARKA
jgi:hypothetical protein